MVEVVVAAEEKFGVEIPDDEVKNLKTVGDAVAYIERRPTLTSSTGIDRRSTTVSTTTSASSSPGSARPPRSAATSPSTWAGPARRPLRRPVADRGLGRRRCRCGSPRRSPSTRARCSTGSRPAAGPLRAARADRRPRGLGRRRLARSVGRASGSASSSAPASAASLTLLGQYDILKEKGPRRVSPHTVPMLMPNGPAALRRPRARRPGRRAHPGQRLRVRRRGDRATAST